MADADHVAGDRPTHVELGDGVVDGGCVTEGHGQASLVHVGEQEGDGGAAGVAEPEADLEPPGELLVREPLDEPDRLEGALGFER